MKIIIDARFWGPSHTGLGVYTRELVTALSRVYDKNSYILFIRREMEKEIILPANFTLQVVEAKPYTFAEQLLLAWYLFRFRPDLVHFPSINVPLLFFGRYVVTVHDIIKHNFRGRDSTTLPEITYWLKYGVYRLAEWLVVARASRVIVPSFAVAAEVERVYPLAKDKTSVTLEAAVLSSKGDTSAKVDLNLPRKFAVYTGNAYPHKNLTKLVIAWKEVYKNTGMELVISSGRSVFSNRIEQLIQTNGAKDYIHFKGYLSDEELKTVYSRANLYVFPSLMEGFGIPALDAMNFNLPVVCSDIAVFREVYGAAASYFDPRDVQAIAKAVTWVENHPGVKQKLKLAGKKQVALYSWKKTAEQTLAVYNKAL